VFLSFTVYCVECDFSHPEPFGLVVAQELAGGTPQPHRMREMAAQLQKSIRFDTDPRRAVKEPPGNREMTFEEKRKLSIAIGRLPGDRLAQVMDIIAEDPYAANVRSLSCGVSHSPGSGISVRFLNGTITRQFQRGGTSKEMSYQGALKIEATAFATIIVVHGQRKRLPTTRANFVLRGAVKDRRGFLLMSLRGADANHGCVMVAVCSGGGDRAGD
jgi:hypothetical protein